MAPKIFFVTESDRDVLRGLIDREKKRIQNTTNRPALPPSEATTPEVYLALTPTGGILATTDDADPQYADCTIFRVLNQNTSLSQIVQAFDATVRVFNPFDVAVAEDSYVLVTRDKFGTWVVTAGGGAGGTVNPDDPGNVVDPAGFTSICITREGGGTSSDLPITGIKLRKRYGDAATGPFRCIDPDPCCLPDYRCVGNSQIDTGDLDGLTDCCAVGTGSYGYTRILEVRFENKTGDAVDDLPDLLYIVHTGGTATLWDDGPVERYWGPYTGTASFLLYCDSTGTDNDLTATLTISHLDAAGPIVVPCDLTNTGVSFGTLNYSQTLTSECGVTSSRSGTVDVTVASWEDGTGAEYTGVQPFYDMEVPPWDAGEPFKTSVEAELCCQPQFYCVDGEIVETSSPLVPAPTGTTVTGPYDTEAEAEENCPIVLSCNGMDVYVPRTMQLTISNITAIGATVGMPFTSYGQGTMDNPITFRCISAATGTFVPDTKPGDEGKCAAGVPFPRSIAGTSGDCHQFSMVVSCEVATAGEVVDWSATEPGSTSAYLRFVFRCIPQGVTNPYCTVAEPSFTKTWSKRLPTVYSDPDATGLDVGMEFSAAGFTAGWTGTATFSW